MHSMRLYLIMFLLTLLSRLFDPAIIYSIVTVVAAFRSIANPIDLSVFLLVFFVLILVPPVVIMYSLIRANKVTNWDVSNRQQRIKVLSGLLGFLLIDCIIVWLVGNPYLVLLYGIFFLWFLGFYVITLYWKISGHTGSLTLAIGLLYMWYGEAVLLGLLVIPLIGWVRVRRNNHTIAQVVGGVVYSLLVLFLCLLLKII